MYPNNYRRYRKQKRNSTIKNVLVFFLLFIIGAGIAFFLSHEGFIWSSMGSDKIEEEIEEEIYFEIVEVIPEVEIVPVEEGIMTIYFDVTQINNEAYIEEVFKKIEEGSAEALVLPMKNSDGNFNYTSKLYYKSVKDLASDLTNIITRAVNEDVHLIAGFSMYRDSNFSAKNADTAIKKANGANWIDYDDKAWVSPYSDVANIYYTQLITEVFSLGFEEIILSDFHFPVDGDYSSIVQDSSMTKEEILLSRLTSFSNLGTINILLSDDALTDKNYISGENIETLSQNSNKIYIKVENDDDLESFNNLDITNKVMVTNNSDYIIGQSSYIIY